MKLDKEISEKLTYTFSRNEIIALLASKLDIRIKDYRIELQQGNNSIRNIEMVLIREVNEGKDFNGK